MVVLPHLWARLCHLGTEAVFYSKPCFIRPGGGVRDTETSTQDGDKDMDADAILPFHTVLLSPPGPLILGQTESPLFLLARKGKFSYMLSHMYQ